MDQGLVGRDDELATLLGWWREAAAGAPRLVLLGGEAGIGKTRLAHELTTAVAATGATAVWGRGTEQEGAPAFWAWRQVLDRLGGAEALDAGDGADPSADRFRRFEAVAGALHRAAGDAGLLVVLDDVHQSDTGSLRLLVHVAGALSGPVLVVATHRTNAADHAEGFAAAIDDLLRLPGTRRLALAGLDRSAVALLLERDHGDPLVGSAADRTGGNPLYLGEVARHLRAGHDPASVPPSVRDAVRARLAARSPACARTLEVAAVAGREFDAGLVATATGDPALTTLEAIDEAIAAGLVEPSDRAGHFRFVHALVREAVEAAQGAAVLPERHRTVAEAIATYHGAGDDTLPDLARHWAAAAALGDREVAAGWCERAAEAADRRTAWEEAARLFDRAVELTGAEVDPVVRHRRLVGAARARLQCDELVVAVDGIVAAAAAVADVGRPDLVAEACLLAEGRGGPTLAPVQPLAEAALAALDPSAHALRARLLGFLAAVAFYVDPESLGPLGLAALDEADRSGDPLAEVAAVRARQMALMEPRHAEERLALAARIGRAGRALGRPTVTQWEAIWKVDALLELGRIGDALAELPPLRQHVDAVGLPMSRWHLARVEAVLAQATGRFDEAERASERAAQLFAQLEDPLGARAMHVGFLVMTRIHTGFDADYGAAVLTIPHEQAPAFLGDLPRMVLIVGHLSLGDRDAARRRYDELAPAAGWVTPPFLRLNLHVLRTMLAVLLDRPGDLPALLAVLDEHRGLHAGTTGGGVTYMGPVELWIGTGRAALGDLDAAAAELRTALDLAAGAGARGFAVQAAVELAEVLTRRAGPGDASAAAELATRWLVDAEVLGMAPWATRLQAVAALPASGAGPLSPRELEVAGLVARGLTNKQIATELYLSERTAQNHVQHILTKLGAANRTQIARWFDQR